MKEKIYKYSVITFVIINFITLYLFYDYLTAKTGMFKSLGLLFDFASLIVFSVGLGIFLLMCRFYFYIRKKTNYLKTNFIYVFTAFFCLNTLINLVVCFSLGLLAFKIEGLLIAITLLIISIFMIYDIYKNNFSEKVIN
jgi:hypothetical protein